MRKHKINVGRSNAGRNQCQAHGFGGLNAFGLWGRQMVGVGCQPGAAVGQKRLGGLTGHGHQRSAFTQVDAFATFGKGSAGFGTDGRKRRKACVCELTEAVAAAGNYQIGQIGTKKLSGAFKSQQAGGAGVADRVDGAERPDFVGDKAGGFKKIEIPDGKIFRQLLCANVLGHVFFDAMHA